MMPSNAVIVGTGRPLMAIAPWAAVVQTMIARRKDTGAFMNLGGLLQTHEHQHRAFAFFKVGHGFAQDGSGSERPVSRLHEMARRVRSRLTGRSLPDPSWAK